MKVLLTGASGFVGSHIVDRLRARATPTVALLRPTSDKRFLQDQLPSMEIRNGALDEPATLDNALRDVTHVVHCAGLVKARQSADFYRINQVGTRNLIEAINRTGGAVDRLVHISSLSANGPTTESRPARETDPPHPVSEYGKSKLAAELEIRERFRAAYTILRPPGVYGPRDYAFLAMFKAVNRHLRPCPTAKQALSLVYVKDLAEAAVTCLDHPATAGQTYFVAGREVVHPGLMSSEIASQSGRRTIPVPVPRLVVWAMCLGQEIVSRLSGRAMLLNLGKYVELSAPGWVCDPSKLEQQAGFRCRTSLRDGIAATLKWYRDNGWL